MTTTTSVVCPAAVSSCGGKCGGEVVEATYAKTVSVAPCTFLLEQGWTGANVVLWHDQALAYLVPAAVEAPVQHAAGLVVLR